MGFDQPLYSVTFMLTTPIDGDCVLRVKCLIPLDFHELSREITEHEVIYRKYICVHFTGGTTITSRKILSDGLTLCFKSATFSSRIMTAVDYFLRTTSHSDSRLSI